MARIPACKRCGRTGRNHRILKVRFHAEAAGKNVVTDQVINLAEKNRHYNRAGPTLCMICYLLMVEESNTGVFPEVPNVE